MPFKRLMSLFILSFMLAISISPIASAEVGNIEYDKGKLQKTESDGDAAESDDKSSDHWWDVNWNEIGNDIGGVLEKGRDFFDPLFDTVGDMGGAISDGWNDATDWTRDTWGDFKDWTSDTWDRLSDWSAHTWDSFTDWTRNTWDTITEGAVNIWNTVSDFAVNVWEHTPNWVKSTLGVLGVGAAIVGGVALGIISAPVAIVAGIGAGVGAGIYYVMNGESSGYSFLGSLGWTAGGALLGGIGQATGAFAAIGRGLLTLGKHALADIKIAYSAGGTLSTIVNGAKLGGAASGVISVVKSLIIGEFSFGNLMIDMVSGGLTGGLLAPISVFAGSLLSTGKFAQYAGWGVPLATFGGMENFIVEGLKGEWSFLDNFLVGSIGGVLAYGMISHMSKWIFKNQNIRDVLGNPASTEIYEEMFGKGAEDIIKDTIKSEVNDPNVDQPNSENNSEKQNAPQHQQEKQQPAVEIHDQLSDNGKNENVEEGQKSKDDVKKTRKTQKTRKKPGSIETLKWEANL